ncbi:FAD dependent oxidoreductase [Mycena galericulata]|nr:FAD dependent oxidoreductase [Mycena galericulata]
MSRKALIVGAGCFGLSTAYELLKRGWSVEVIDRSTILPPPDSASNDFNRIVRTSYSDPFYAKLAQEAIRSWRDQAEWNDTYHESGVLILGSRDSGVDYAHRSYLNDMEMGLRVEPLDSQTALREVFPPGAHVGSFVDRTRYLNRDGGWANAGQGVSVLMRKIVALGGKIIPGKNAAQIIQQGHKTTSVRCSDGTVFHAERFIIATGSWTKSAFPSLSGNIFQATGQCTAMVQLTQEEGDIYRKCPVVLDFKSGFYVFPPNEENLVKMAVHAGSSGYTHSVGLDGISTPRTVTSDPETGLLIPKTNVKELRDGLRMVYPALAEKPFVATRMCWYNDSVDGDWVIGYHPESQNSLMFATAGSGHAYKFLPVIGRLVADVIEEKLGAELVAKFALNRIPKAADESRPGEIARELDLTQLCTPEDLQ